MRKGSGKLPDRYLKGSSQGLKVANFLQEGSTADRKELDLTASLCSRDLGFGVWHTVKFVKAPKKQMTITSAS